MLYICTLQVARERPDGSGIDYPSLLPGDRQKRALKLMLGLIFVFLSGKSVLASVQSDHDSEMHI